MEKRANANFYLNMSNDVDEDCVANFSVGASVGDGFAENHSRDLSFESRGHGHGTKRQGESFQIGV